VKVGPFW